MKYKQQNEIETNINVALYFSRYFHRRISKSVIQSIWSRREQILADYDIAEEYSAGSSSLRRVTLVMCHTVFHRRVYSAVQVIKPVTFDAVVNVARHLQQTPMFAHTHAGKLELDHHWYCAFCKKFGLSIVYARSQGGQSIDSTNERAADCPSPSSTVEIKLEPDQTEDDFAPIQGSQPTGTQ